MLQLGKQEDAEEFLSCILDGLHEEMSAAVNLNAGETNNYTGNYTVQISESCEIFTSKCICQDIA